ncbi:hypothetical protein RKE38_03660 [Phycicoccus sp. M110.8]|uniref:hypothetical protein n=1 Tax=Phycicoccus sp. M110.8 TaxID=3075433 RepID=UPI0028FD78F7|nr:hypothetical protein [Phycicoccus sp. M110.8]MDU0312770.1 hypothetical protein [Phycicoccus sp. M110.8]
MDYSIDPRAATVVVRTSDGFRPLVRADLEEVADRWASSPHIPEAIEHQLHVARQLYTHSLLVWEFGAVAVSTALLAVESALRLRLGAKRSENFAGLISRAHAAGLITDDMRSFLDIGRDLRNRFSHPTYQQVWSLGMTAPALRTSFEVIAGLFRDGAAVPDASIR